MEDLKKRLRHSLSTPEQLFGQNALTLTHTASGTQLSFTADGALTQWKRADLPPVRVGLAQKWQSQRQQDISSNAAARLEYDWCRPADAV